MNKSISIFIFAIGFTFICSCSSHFPDKIERYVLKHNILNGKGFGEVDLREVLRVDYDTMYVFHSLLPLNGVQNIIGIKTYGDAEDPYTALIGSDSEMCRVIFIKNNKVVYEDEYYYLHYKLQVLFETFYEVSKCGIFDGTIGPVNGYMCTKHHFTVSRVSDDEYVMK
ncbi:hypothetical protein HMPREF9151_00845 [Hoylesella saccharolytica F0055]|uniref:Lipoprotein n=1 Tax=Hoylesella saccharolytica F0055 TaxID=1127699 RepID=L1NFN8_9BACT|nr:hypothetical protein [Hoylesella saccharolytica]EKY02100.1 hypothetical protein HMPREF9151_00845 [Hoylesella saccharolytica F0055]